MLRTYGKAPFECVVLHGGPGAPGSAGLLSRLLHEKCGVSVAEPWQSRNSIAELLTELDEQLDSLSVSSPFALVGHSWGAWLAALYTLHRPEKVGRLVFIGSGPLRETRGIDELRRSRFSESDAARYSELLSLLNSGGEGACKTLLAELGAICRQADIYAEDPESGEEVCSLDRAQYAAIWNEAAAWRRSGKLEADFCRLPLAPVLICGDYDPHPADGVSAVLAAHGRPFSRYVLVRCGHEPWLEKYASAEFFRTMEKVLKTEI